MASTPFLTASGACCTINPATRLPRAIRWWRRCASWQRPDQSQKEHKGSQPAALAFCNWLSNREAEILRQHGIRPMCTVQGSRQALCPGDGVPSRVLCDHGSRAKLPPGVGGPSGLAGFLPTTWAPLVNLWPNGDKWPHLANGDKTEADRIYQRAMALPKPLKAKEADGTDSPAHARQRRVTGMVLGGSTH